MSFCYISNFLLPVHTTLQMRWLLRRILIVEMAMYMAAHGDNMHILVLNAIMWAGHDDSETQAVRTFHLHLHFYTHEHGFSMVRWTAITSNSDPRGHPGIC